MRIVLALASWTAAALALVAEPGPAEAGKGLSQDQIRSVMRSHAGAFNRCLDAALRQHKELHGPFLYDLEIDRAGQVTSVRPFQPSPVPAFDRCVIGVLKRARFPGGPATIEAPLVFDPS